MDIKEHLVVLSFSMPRRAHYLCQVVALAFENQLQNIFQLAYSCLVCGAEAPGAATIPLVVPVDSVRLWIWRPGTGSGGGGTVCGEATQCSGMDGKIVEVEEVSLRVT